MTVYYELDPTMKLPLVPIVQNCAVPPLMPLRRAYEFGKALGDAIRGYTGAAAGGRHRRRWALALDRQPARRRHRRGVRPLVPQRLERGELDQVLDMPDSEIELAGNGNHEMRTWVAVAGAMEPGPGHDAGLRTGLPVDHRHGRRPVGRASPDREKASATAEAQDTTRGVSDMSSPTDSSSRTDGATGGRAQRVRDLSEQVLAQAKKNGLAFLEGYERVLKKMLDLEEQAAKGTGAGLGDDAGEHACQLRPGDLRGVPRRPCGIS